MIGVNLISEKYGIIGNVDEIHTLEDGSMAPLDYKFTRYDQIFKTHRNQLVMYALMIEEVLTKSSKGFIVYCREENRLVEIDITKEDKEKVNSYIEEYKNFGWILS